MRLLMVLAVVVLAWPLTVAATSQRPLPNSMAVAGDSIARAFNTCRFPYMDCPANSWATGTNSTVRSHYARILADNSRIKRKNYNDAKSGAKVADLAAQMSVIDGRNVQYVAVDIGGNDICTPSVGSMTEVDSFESSLRSALGIITADPNVQTVYLTSIPNAYRLWEIFHTNADARSTWERFDVCQSLLANPLSTAEADVARREEVRNHNIALNQALERVCESEYGPKCVFDNWAVYCTDFATTDITTRDYFHPSVAGQKRFSEQSWFASPFVASPTDLGSDCSP